MVFSYCTNYYYPLKLHSNIPNKKHPGTIIYDTYNFTNSKCMYARGKYIRGDRIYSLLF